MNCTMRQLKDAIWAFVEGQYKPGRQNDINTQEMQYIADQMGVTFNQVWMCCTHEMYIWVL